MLRRHYNIITIVCFSYPTTSQTNQLTNHKVASFHASCWHQNAAVIHSVPAVLCQLLALVYFWHQLPYYVTLY